MNREEDLLRRANDAHSGSRGRPAGEELPFSPRRYGARLLLGSVASLAALACGAFVILKLLPFELPSSASGASSVAPVEEPFSSRASAAALKRSENNPLTEARPPSLAAPEGEPEENLHEEEPARGLPFNAPDMETYRAEVEKDPHGTPPSLLDLATRVAERQSEAVQNPALRRAFFNELGRCARDEGGRLPPSVRSFCLGRLARFSKRFPDEFGALYERDYLPLTETLPGNLAAQTRERGTR